MKILLKKREQKQSEIFNNAVKMAFAFMLIPIQMIDFIFLEELSIANLGYNIALGFSLAMLVTSVGNYYFYKINLLVYVKEGEKSKKKYIFIIDIISCICLLFARALNNGLLALIFIGIHLLFSFYLGLYITVHSLKLIRFVKTRYESFKLKSMVISGMSMFLSYLMFLLDELIGPGELSILGVLGLFLAIFISYGFYISYASPKWLRKRFPS